MRKPVNFLFTLFILLSLSAQGFSENVFEIASDRKVYYRYQEAEAGKPTLVLLNGLIYKLEYWNQYIDLLTDQGIGVLQLAYSTQPESLVHLNGEKAYYSKLKWTPMGPNQSNVSVQDFVDETMALINHLSLTKFSLLSLSYGSIVASELAVQNKSRIDNLIFAAPAVVTSGRYNAYGISRHTYYENLVAVNSMAANYYYDAEIYNTLTSLITPLKYSFEDVVFSDFFNGVYQMARSSKWFDLKDYATMDLPNTYLFLASKEDEPLYEDQQRFWSLMDANPAKKSKVTFVNGYHAITGLYPEEAFEQTLKVLTGTLIDQESTVTVGTGNPIGTQGSLFDLSGLITESTEESQ